MQDNVGVKYDQGKPKLHLIPPEFIISVGEVLTFGADKYGERNWENGIDYDRLMSACLRHIVAYQAGEELDPESGLSHLAHASTNLAMLISFKERENNGT